MIEEPAPAKRTGTTRQAGSPWWQSPDTEHERGDPPDPPFDDPDDEPFDDADDEYPPTRRSGAGRRRPEDLRASLREAVADRVPPALRPGRATIPLRAALAAMLIAVALGAALLA
ncbi:MAG TPA: hypothetical protein VHN80_08975, partial [Kineosporiaceae bacterium]|nr:hypothetical protein [Kineosporiaceae bacterium]